MTLDSIILLITTTGCLGEWIEVDFPPFITKKAIFMIAYLLSFTSVPMETGYTAIGAC